MTRRTFSKLTSSGFMVAISPSLITQTLFAKDGSMYKSYERSKLVDENGNAIKVSNLKSEVSYVFHYPYISTPCFLLKLLEPTNKEVKLMTSLDEEYVWSGGSGKDGTIVAFSAICTHALTHPTPEDSYITYVPKKGKTLAYEKGGIIVCSSHLSAFDPKDGGKRLAGSAQDPLASIVLEYDKEKDELYAVGVLGDARFHGLFRRFKPQLLKRFGKIKEVKKFVSLNSKTIPLKKYTKEIIQY